MEVSDSPVTVEPATYNHPGLVYWVFVEGFQNHNADEYTPFLNVIASSPSALSDFHRVPYDRLPGRTPDLSRLFGVESDELKFFRLYRKRAYFDLVDS